ncbi:MAG TPA: N-acetyltransferase, partial [bacterium]|nr:N-acetyltransferase [bacterium]
MNKFLEGQRIYLRPFARSDISIWFDWFNDPLVTQFMNKGIFPNTELVQEEFFESILKSKNDVQLAIILKDDDSLIGIVGIHKINWAHRHGDISILIGDKAQWGKGIATEAVGFVVKHAFTKMNLRRLTAGMPAVNAGSRKCFKNNGFVLEGTQRKTFFCDEEY